MQPGRAGPFLQGDVQLAADATDELDESLSLSLEDSFHHQLAVAIQHRGYCRCLMYVETDILRAAHEGAPFVGDSAFNNLPKRGALS